MNRHEHDSHTDPVTVTDDQLLDRFYAHDGNALGELAGRAWDSLCRFAVRRMSDLTPGRWHTAEDAVSEAFLKVVVTRKRPDARWTRSKGTAMQWLRGIVRNTLNSRLRQERSEAANSQRSAALRGPNDAGGLLGRSSEQFDLTAAIACLPPIRRQVLTMKFNDGLKQKEIAERLHTSKATVSRLVATSLEELGTVLGNDQAF